MTMLVFLGPSLPVAEARRHLDAHYLPPCAMGDVHAAVERFAPTAIGIVDGYFECTPAVWHKEILHALSQRIAVFGASSMGALRAAELAAFGMRGIGRVFDAYASGEIEDDDEVAVTHLPAADGYRLASEPMVNIRYGLELARDAGLVDATEAAALVAEAKALYYPERSWAGLWAGETAGQIPASQLAELRAYVRDRHPDIKREDAVLMLDAMRAWTAAAEPAAQPNFAFEPTVFWEHLRSYRSRDVSEGGAGIARERLIDHVRLAETDRERLVDEAMLQHLVEREAARAGLALPDDRAAMTRFRSERGLASPAALQRWMAEQRLGPQACLALARGEALRRQLRWRCAEAINDRLPAVLQREGRYGVALAAAARKQAAAADARDAATSEIDDALGWYQQVYGKIGTTIEAHCAELGFGSPRQFTAELLATYLDACPDTMEVRDAA